VSNAQFLLIGNWLVEGVVRKDFAGRFKRAFTSIPCLVFLSFFGLHVAGLLWTTDMEWGLDLCRILLPVLAFAPVLASSPRLTSGELRTVLLLGAWSVVVSTMVCLGLRYDVIGRGGYRELSVFISHIRLALLVCSSVAVFVIYTPVAWWKRLAHWAAMAWCVFFLDRLSSLLGLGALMLMVAYGVWRWSSGARSVMRWSLRAGLILLPLAAIVYGQWCVNAYFRSETIDLSALDDVSAGGERYYHDRVAPLRENGHYVWVNVADHELERAWGRRSQMPFKGVDAEGQYLRHTLVRYLASMGVRKDSVGMLALRDEDVRRVEQGVTSVVAGRRDPIRARIDEVLYEWEHYQQKGNASGHSVAMRYEFLRAGWAIAKDHWLVGVGTGDTRPAFADRYVQLHSSLDEQWRLRAHNEYLTLLISFGILGLAWSLFAWIWPAMKLHRFADPVFVCWAIIFGLSCFSEDTIETQTGATFFAFFYAVLVFAAPLSATAPTRVAG
jgi:O-Antigen ligase